MDLRHLRYLVTVAEEGQFSRAAQRLNVTQSAVTAQIKHLEEEVGLPLFHRSKAGATLTPEGHSLHAHATDLLHRAYIAEESMQKFGTPAAKKVNVGYVPGAMPRYLGEAIWRMRMSSEPVSVLLQAMTPQEQVEALRSKQLDIALLGIGPPEWKKEFDTHVMSSSRVVVVLSSKHPLRDSRRLDLAALSDEPFLALAEKQFPGMSALFDEACRRSGFTPRIVGEADSLRALVGLASSRVGIGLAPATIESIPHRGVGFVPLNKPAILAESIAAVRRSEKATIVKDVATMLANCAASCIAE